MARQDRLVADVDRGFNALEKGDLEEAEACLERCSRIDRKHEDVIRLAAAVADAQGDAEKAIARYGELSQIAPDDPMPRICLARLHLHDMGDPDTALDILDEAFEFIDDESDLVEAIVVRTEALIATEDLEGARSALGELSSSVIDDPHLAFDLAELALAAEDPRTALKWIEVARRDKVLAADAMHLLGRAHEQRGESEEMAKAWLEVRRIDLAGPAPQVTISEDELERIALGALDELPKIAREKLEQVPILIDDVPSEDLVKEGIDPRTLGLIEGPTMAEPGTMGSVTHIRLFKRNLEAMATDLDHLADEVRITVLHETAHYFGLEDDDLEKIGLD